MPSPRLARATLALGAAFALVLSTVGCSEGTTAPAPPDAAPPAPAPVATLSALEGSVTRTHAGQRAAAAPGPVFEGDVIETGSDGHAKLKAGQREVELLEDSVFRVGPTLATLELSAGDLVFEDTAGGTFETSKGSGRTDGGRVRLRQDDGGLRFEVSAGSFEFVDAEDGGVAQVNRGQGFELGAGVFTLEDVPTPVAPVKPVLARAPLTLIARGGVTLRRSSGGPSALGSEAATLTELGTLNVSRTGAVRAELPGGQLLLDGPSQATLEPGAGDAPTRALLTQGSGRLFLEKGARVLLDGAHPLTLEATEGLTALVTPTKQGPRIELVGGQAQVRGADGTTQALDAGDIVTPRGTKLERGHHGAPTLSLGHSTRVTWSKPGDVQLSFGEGTGPVEVATDSEFKNVVVRSTGDSVVVPAPLKGVLAWRRVGDADASIARFEREQDAAALSAKNDVVAETGLKATIYFQGAVPSLTFAFPARDGTPSWRFRLYAVSDLKTPLVDRNVKENKAVVESGLVREGSYVWSAVPLEANGSEAAGGRMNKMDVVFDNSVTRLIVTSPRDGERSSTATGVAPLGARLTLNGKAIALDAGGRFQAPVPPESVLVFRLVTREGQELQTIRRVPRGR